MLASQTGVLEDVYLVYFGGRNEINLSSLLPSVSCYSYCENMSNYAIEIISHLHKIYIYAVLIFGYRCRLLKQIPKITTCNAIGGISANCNILRFCVCSRELSLYGDANEDTYRD